jgi:hypothetical protein
VDPLHGVCKCGLAKVAADVKKNTVRIVNVEAKADQLEADAISQKSSIELLEPVDEAEGLGGDCGDSFGQRTGHRQFWR